MEKRGSEGDLPRPMDFRVYIPEIRAHLSPLYVLPKPGGTIRFPRPLLIKPGRTFNEIIQGLMGDAKPFRAEMIAQKIKSSLGPAYQELMLYYR